MRSSRSRRGASFATFMDQAGPALLRIAWFLTGDADHAQELTQAALIRTYLAWPKIDHDGALPYARRCLVNHKLDPWRAPGHETADVSDAGPGLIPGSVGSGSVGSGSQPRDDRTSTPDHREDLVRRLARLPEQQRKVVVLRYYADQSEAAVADALGISLDMVRGVASRGLAALHEHAQAPVQTQDHSSSSDRPAMSIDLERDLRREFDGATLPSALTFHPESVVRQGRQTIRRRRTLVGGSAALAIALLAGGAAVLNRPHDVAAPQPAIPTATSGTTSGTTSGIVRAQMVVSAGTFQIEINRNVQVGPNVKLFVVATKDGPRRELGAWSTNPGQKPDAIWKSGMIAGHPFTVGLIPGKGADVKLAGEVGYVIMSDEVKGTDFTMFAVQYIEPPRDDPNAIPKEAARPVRITSVSWSGPTGVVDGIEGGHRLAGRIFPIDKLVSVKVILRPGKGGRTLVSGTVRLNGSSTILNDSTTNDSGAAVVIGSYLILRPVSQGRSQGTELVGGAPIAAGILPAGASDIGVILTTGEVAVGRPVSDRLADGRVIFAIKAESALPSEPSKDSIKAVRWTNANGSQGRMNVPPQKR